MKTEKKAAPRGGKKSSNKTDQQFDCNMASCPIDLRKPIHWKCCSLQRGNRGAGSFPKVGPSRGQAAEVCRAGSLRRSWYQGYRRSKSNWGILYEKGIDANGLTVPCEVRVFPMIVKWQLDTWPEAHEREARWFEPAKALSAIKDRGLRELIESFFPRKSHKRPK